MEVVEPDLSAASTRLSEAKPTVSEAKPTVYEAKPTASAARQVPPKCQVLEINFPEIVASQGVTTACSPVMKSESVAYSPLFRDMESLKNALVLNGMIAEECLIASSQAEEPEYLLQPGWDDDEAAQVSEEPQ